MSATPPLKSKPHNSRYETIDNEFSKFGGKPELYVRAPGRVNLIGEHIDYCGYAVLPMAIEQDIVAAARVNPTGGLRLANTDERYRSFGTTVAAYEIDKKDPQWYHYFFCGYKGICEYCGISQPLGLDVVFDGTVPPSAGLSSSSALVCAAALVTAHAHKKDLPKLTLAEITAKCECYIGMEGGGMDQSISFLAEPGTAKLIQFSPIRATDVQLPEGSVFVVSNSCVELNKAATSHYNTRVAECRLACMLLAHARGLQLPADLRKLDHLQNQLSATFEEMENLVEEVLHREPYSRQEVCEILGISDDELRQKALSERTYSLESFKLYDRAKHVYGEAGRVWKFKEVCDNQQPNALQQLGELMNQSHSSCRDLYDCSCAELDELTDICRSAGALGSRLTGAGWAGCAVSLVREDNLDAFLKEVKAKFYDVDERRRKMVDVALFVSKPGGGAAILN